MALTKVTSGMVNPDPSDASNLSSGSVPAARIDTSGIENDLALIAFKVASNGSLAKYNLVDQTVDAFEDASGIDASASTNESRNASNYYSGVSSSSGNATGDGTQTTHGSYTVDTFLADGDWIAPSTNTVSVLVVGGGGGGGGGSGASFGAGGGAGGFRTDASYSALAQTYAVTVGDGGAGGAADSYGSYGNDSVFGTITSTKGGRGSTANQSVGGDGGSGGGSGTNSTGGSGNTPSTSPSQGNDGGSWNNSNANVGAPSGGGAGAAGEFPNNLPFGGYGGDGLEYDYRTGSNVFYAGGGGGAYGGSAGNGGGGSGGTAATGPSGGVGTANSGGGGGGGNRTAGLGGAGGSGIVVIRYTTNSFTTEAVADMTLVSNATTALEGAPTKASLVVTYTDGAGTASVGTDIKFYISRDGSNYTGPITMTSEGSTGGHNILTANDVSLTSASGTSMRWKITTHNQSVSKDTRIQAVSLGWS